MTTGELDKVDIPPHHRRLFPCVRNRRLLQHEVLFRHPVSQPDQRHHHEGPKGCGELCERRLHARHEIVKQFLHSDFARVFFQHAVIRSAVQRLFPQSNLVHEILIVPEQPLVVHCAPFSMPNCHHAQCEVLAGWMDRFAVRRRHRLCERPRHYA
jgi:hypothetical protein